MMFIVRVEWLAKTQPDYFGPFWRRREAEDWAKDNTDPGYREATVIQVESVD